ncbi:hypothetical protein COB28_04695 [Candidatus Dependentiae bacterium]|nr:MAG: hypothetical protein COB28_04695 [Candidatus Dependentiae bacterium]
MKHTFFSFFYPFIFTGISFCFNGCVKYYDLLPSETPQASTKEIELSFISKSIEDVKFYREFVTEGIFNLLWKSPTNSNIILEMYASRRGLSLKQRERIIKKNQEMHNNYISFFVLAYILDTQRPDLHDTDPTWTMYLKTKDGHKVAPAKIKPMDMTPELATIFGKRNTNFKQLYYVKFPRKYRENHYKKVEIQHSFTVEKNNTVDTDEPNNPQKLENIKEIVVEKIHDIYDAEELTLVINSVELEEKIDWPIEPHRTGTLDLTEISESNKEGEFDEDFDWI